MTSCVTAVGAGTALPVILCYVDFHDATGEGVTCVVSVDVGSDPIDA